MLEPIVLYSRSHRICTIQQISGINIPRLWQIRALFCFDCTENEFSDGSLIKRTNVTEKTKMLSMHRNSDCAAIFFHGKCDAFAFKFYLFFRISCVPCEYGKIYYYHCASFAYRVYIIPVLCSFMEYFFFFELFSIEHSLFA